MQWTTKMDQLDLAAARGFQSTHGHWEYCCTTTVILVTAEQKSVNISSIFDATQNIINPAGYTLHLTPLF